MAGRIIETLRALQRPKGSGSFFGSDQAQFFTPKFGVSTYAQTTLGPQDGYYATLLYRIRFPPYLHPNAFTLNLIHRGDALLAAVLTGGYIANGFGDDGSLFIPLTTAQPLTIRIQNDDTVPKMWSGDFDLLSIQTREEFEVVLAYLNDEGKPDIAGILARGDAWAAPGVQAPIIGEPGGYVQRDAFGQPIQFPQDVPGTIRGGDAGTGVRPPQDLPGQIRGF